jgi:DNA adenine methylase
MVKVISPAVRYHGAKFRLAPWIISHFPKHKYYVEPFGGAAGVLLQKPRSDVEVYNDLDGDIVNFFRVLRDPELCKHLIEQCVLTPYSRDEFERAFEPAEDSLEKARRLVIRACMGFGSAGASRDKTGFRVDMKRPYSTAMDVWAKYPDGLSNIGLRLAGVQIENRPAVSLFERHDDNDTLFYLDPPYVHNTRVIHGKTGYNHEMTDEQHVELLNAARELKSMVIISGYESELYNDLLTGWTKNKTSSRISAGRGTDVRTEVIWMNKSCTDQSTQLKLFEELK